MTRLTRAVESLHGDVERLVARQEFVESLLERERGELRASDPRRVGAGEEVKSG